MDMIGKEDLVSATPESNSDWDRPVDTIVSGQYGRDVVTAIAKALEEKLKTWRPRTARKVERLVAEIIAAADHETPRRRNSQSPKVSWRNDPFFADKRFWPGKVPRNSASNHDKYLYGDAAYLR